MQAAHGHCISVVDLGTWCPQLCAAMGCSFISVVAEGLHSNSHFARHSCMHIMAFLCKRSRVSILTLHLHVFAPAPAHCQCESVLRHHGAACFSKAPGETMLRQGCRSSCRCQLQMEKKSHPPPPPTCPHTQPYNWHARCLGLGQKGAHDIPFGCPIVL